MTMFIALHMLTLKYLNQRRVHWANYIISVVFKPLAWISLWLLSVFFPYIFIWCLSHKMKVIHLSHPPGHMQYFFTKFEEDILCRD